MIFLNRSFISLLFFINILNATANDSETVTEIDQPRFSEKGLDQKSYEIKAQKGLRYSDELVLFEIEGKFKTDNGLWIYMNADEGDFRQKENIINLNKNVNFYTENGDRILSENAIFKMNEELIIFRNNVSHENADSIIKSSTVTVSNNFNDIVYEGQVLTEISK